MRLVPLTLVSLFVGAAVWACGGDDGSGSSGTGGSGGDTGDGDGDTNTNGDGDPGDGDGDGTGGGGDGDGDGTGGGSGGGGGDECVGDVTRCTDDESEVEVCVEGSWETRECSSSIPLCDNGSCDPENCDGCLIDDQCYPDGTSNQENSCQVCDAPGSDWSNIADGESCGDNGSCDAGVCACTDGWTGSDCTTCVVYVKTDGDDNESGLSWDGALADINMALELAASRRIDEDLDSCQVWVAEGTYKPGTELTSTFQLQEHVDLYGGFAGNETLLSQRDWEEHETILSGDLAGDDAAGDLEDTSIPLHRDDNVYHLVTLSDEVSINGLTLRGGGNGSLDVDDPDANGGATIGSSVAAQMWNCTLTDNYASGEGAAIYASDAQVVFNNSSVTGNAAVLSIVFLEMSTLTAEAVRFSENFGYRGLFADHSQVTLRGGEFERNRGTSGAALYIDVESDATISDCSFKENVASSQGGAVLVARARAEVIDSTFNDNSAVELGGALTAARAQVAVANSIFDSNSADEDYGGAINNWGNAATSIVNSVFSNNTARIGSAMSNRGEETTLEIVNCTFFGNDPSATNGTLSNFEGQTRVFNSVFWGGNTPEIVHVAATTTETTVAYSDVQGGYSGTDNLDVDPKFVDAASGDLRLASDSPLLNQGSAANLPEDILDLDGDANVSEPLPVDLDGNARVVGSEVDVGAYERP